MTESMYGTYTVTTEGDCEGRTIKNLGTHTGHVDEIAFALAHMQFYSLSFRKTPPAELPVDRGGKSVNITMSDFGNGSQRHVHAAMMLRGRPVKVQHCNYYEAVTLIREISPEAEARLARESALAKLSAEDRLALGL